MLVDQGVVTVEECCVCECCMTSHIFLRLCFIVLIYRFWMGGRVVWPVDVDVGRLWQLRWRKAVGLRSGVSYPRPGASGQAVILWAMLLSIFFGCEGVWYDMQARCNCKACNQEARAGHTSWMQPQNRQQDHPKTTRTIA